MNKIKSGQRATPFAFLAEPPKGICGLDEITQGGLSKGRPTLVSGAAGPGKTLLVIHFKQT